MPTPLTDEQLEKVGFDLWDFQSEDVAKLQNQKARLIASEMGGGKTREAIALTYLNLEDNRPVGIERDRCKTLVLAKKSALDTIWAKQWSEVRPDARIRIIDPQARGAFVRAVEKGDGDVFIMHWDALRLIPEVRQQMWFHIIGDEVHKIKNRKAQVSRAADKMRAYFKSGLSGSPVTNKPHDYWHILNWLRGSEFGSYWKFYAEFVDYQVIYPQGFHKIKGVKNAAKLLAMVQPYYVRHLKKKQCCPHHPNGIYPWLPDKYWQQLEVDLHFSQRVAYREMAKEMIAWVGENRDKPLIAPVTVAKLIRLQQFAMASVDLVDDERTGETHAILSEPSSKLDMVMDLLEDSDDEKQFVVFSQSSQVLQLLMNRMRAAGYTCCIMIGDTKQDERRRMQDDFQAGKIKVFCSTIQTGGESIELYAADTVIFIDRCWEPPLNAQAEDRLWRPGQKNDVHVIDIVARNTVDRGRHQMLQLKAEWIRELLGDVK